MPSISATRHEVSDRFEVLGFTVKTGRKPYFQVVLVSDLDALLDKGKRTSTFWASSPIAAEKGEAIFLVPSEVLKRFAGKPRLYYGLATFADANRTEPEIVSEPNQSGPWINLGAYTGRSNRRAMTLRPQRRGENGNGYGGGKPEELEWAGDLARPGTESIPTPSAGAAPRNGNGKANGNGNGHTTTAAPPPAASAGLAYDDGFGEMPAEPVEESIEDYGIDGPLEEGGATPQGQAYGRPFTTAAEYAGASSFIEARHFQRPAQPRAINRIVIHITDGHGPARGTADYFADPQQYLPVAVVDGELQMEFEGDRCTRFLPNRWKNWTECVGGKTKVKNGSTLALARVTASAHYVVGQDGEVIQMVRNADIAYHANSANRDSIGIEHGARTPGAFGKNDAGLFPTDVQYRESARLVCWLASCFGIPKDRTHILGHSEADTKTTHTQCPNAVWDWDKFMTLITDGSCDPGPVATGSAFEAEIPLDPGTGGMSIAEDSLQIGDIIVSTTAEFISNAIRGATGSPVSHAMIYTGDGGQVVEAIGDGVVFRPLTEALASATVAVAFRHPDLTQEQKLRIRDFAGQQIDKRYNYWGVVRQARFIMHSAVCNLLSGAAQERCRTFHGRVFLGSGSDDTFFCSQLVLAAYEATGLPLTTAAPNWGTPGDIAELQLTGRLAYVGHLKAPPLPSTQAYGASVRRTNGQTRPAAPARAAVGPLALSLAVEPVAARLRRQGVSASALNNFCARLTAPVSAYVPPVQPPAARALDGRLRITLPGATRLEGWQAELFLAALGAAMMPFGGGLTLVAVRLAANTSNVTIGVGPVVGAGLLAGGSLGAGIVFAPDNHVGLYGATEVSAGLIASISAALQVTVVGGGLANFGGEGYAIGISGGEGITGGVAVLLSTSEHFQGVSFQAGVGAGLSPIDIYTSAQRTYTTAQALARQQALGAAPALAAFEQGAIDRMRQEFLANVTAGNTRSCTAAALRHLYGSALKNHDGTDKPLGATIKGAMANLETYGLAQPSTDFEFHDTSAQLTKGITRPERLQLPVEARLLSEAAKNSAPAWNIFGLSIMDGYHGVILALAPGGSGNGAPKVYWADQMGSGWDDVTGALDARIAQRTQGWWDPLPGDRKARTRVTVWPLIPGAPPVTTQGFSACAPNRQARGFAEITPDYSAVSSFAGAAQVFFEWLSRRVRFTLGVSATTFFPHSAICKIRAIDGNGNGLGSGTGFYVGRNTILTAGTS